MKLYAKFLPMVIKIRDNNMLGTRAFRILPSFPIAVTHL